MQKRIEKLQKVAKGVLRERERLSLEVAGGGKPNPEGPDRVLLAIHRLHTLLFSILVELIQIAEGLRNDSRSY